MKKAGFPGRVPVTLVAGIVVVLLSLGTYWLFFGSGFNKVFARTSTTLAIVTSVEPAGEGSNVHFEFETSGGYKKSSKWTTYPPLVSEAESGRINVWYDPLDPDNNGIEEPRFWFEGLWNLIGWSIIATWICIYIVMLDDFWGWGFIKKPQL